MIDFSGGQITDIMPDNLKQDPAVQAVSFAISNGIKNIIEHTKKAGVYAAIDLLEESVLDILAVELRTQYYGNWLTLKEKKESIKKTIQWYYRAGTLETVKELTDFVYQDAKIEEWFIYGGGAYLFRLLVQVTNQDIAMEKYLKYLQSLHTVKNARSHLEAVIFNYNTKAEIKNVSAAGMGICFRVKAGLKEKIRAETEIKPVIALKVSQVIRIMAGTENL